jgi:tuberculosinol/isotuberculosinol synthase
MVADLVRSVGTSLCAFDINGTRRWFLAEYPDPRQQTAAAYCAATIHCTCELIRLFFDHGLTTLLLPSMSLDATGRGEEYLRLSVAAWRALLTEPQFVDLCQAYGVRVQFYGDYRKVFGGPLGAEIEELFQHVMSQTAQQQRRLFFGVFAHDTIETVAALAIRLYQAQGNTPNRRQLIQAYYGADLPPVDLFIGFQDRFTSFDLPLLDTSEMDRYFIAAPSLYLNQRQLRTILYDHLYTRRQTPDYTAINPEDWGRLRNAYRNCGDQIQGIGAQFKGIWHPSTLSIHSFEG